MKLTPGEFQYLGQCLEGFLFGELFNFTTSKALSKEIQHYFISGIYSGIFAVHLHYHASKERTGDNTKHNIIFYALCILYMFSALSLLLILQLFGLTYL